MRKPWVWIGLAVVVVAALAVGAVLVVRAATSASVAAQPECTVPAVTGAPVTVIVEGPQSEGAGAAGNASAHASPTPSTSVTSAPDVALDAVPLQYAATINAVGLHRGLPERARIIAVATAWQESRLRNLPAGSGDRDSVGLFQQRPSQGWGKATQLADPVFAAGAFYDALLKVDGWQQMSLTAAAQSVQFSAYPDAYAQWEPQATTLVRALSGADPPTLSCRAGAQPPTTPAPTRTPLAGTTKAAPALIALVAAAQAELGGLTAVSVSADGLSATLKASLPGRSADAAADALAGWVVAHATGYGAGSVSAGRQTWANHAWSAGPALPSGSVVVSVPAAGSA